MSETKLKHQAIKADEGMNVDIKFSAYQSTQQTNLTKLKSF